MLDLPKSLRILNGCVLLICLSSCSIQRVSEKNTEDAPILLPAFEDEFLKITEIAVQQIKLEQKEDNKIGHFYIDYGSSYFELTISRQDGINTSHRDILSASSTVGSSGETMFFTNLRITRNCSEQNINYDILIEYNDENPLSDLFLNEIMGGIYILSCSLETIEVSKLVRQLR